MNGKILAREILKFAREHEALAIPDNFTVGDDSRVWIEPDRELDIWRVTVVGQHQAQYVFLNMTYSRHLLKEQNSNTETFLAEEFNIMLEVALKNPRGVKLNPADSGTAADGD